MTGKKKVGILATLALCVTVGGVYATWMYADTSAAIESQHKHLAQDLAGSTTTGAVGTLKVETAGLKFVIDQASDAHDAKLVWTDTTATQSLPVTFMPSATASDLIKTQGINVYYTFETTGTWDFDGEGGEGAKALYSVASDKYEVQMTLGADSNGDGIADFHGSIPVSVVTDAVKLNGTLILDTKDDYDLFKTALDGIKVGVTVAHDVNDEADPYQLPND